MKTIYQIRCKGYSNTCDEVQTISSKDVYNFYPTQEVIDTFVKKCTTPLHAFDLCYLQKEGIIVEIVELNLIG